MATVWKKELSFSPRDDVVTQRPSATAILGIDSEDRFTDQASRRAGVGVAGQNNPYDFVIQKNENIMTGFPTRLATTELSFAWVIPNIGPKSCQINLIWTTGGAPQTALITLPQGFYTPYELAAAMTAQLVALLPGGFTTPTMRYGTYGTGAAPNEMGTPQMTYGATATSGYYFGFAPMVPNTTTYPYGSECKQLFDVLGFTNQNSLLTAAQPYAGQSTFCQSIRYIDIVCSQLTYNQALKDTMSQPVARDTLCRVYITNGTEEWSQQWQTSAAPGIDYSLFTPSGCRPFQIYRDFTYPKQIQWKPDQSVPSGLRFQVYDDVGNLLTSSLNVNDQSAPSVDWSMTMLVSEN